MLTARIFTLYPEVFPGPLNKGLYGKALSEKKWKLDLKKSFLIGCSLWDSE